MKKILLLAAMLGLGGVANATVTEVLESSITVNTVSISSFAATAITTSATLMNDRTSLVLQNLDEDNNIYCSQFAAVIAASKSFVIPAGYGMISLNLRSYSAEMKGPLQLYCISASTTGSSTLAVIQSY